MVGRLLPAQAPPGETRAGQWQEGGPSVGGVSLDRGVHHDASEVGEALWDAGLAGGARPDAPAHPFRGGGGNRLRQGATFNQGVRDIVREMPSVPAVEEGAHLVRGASSGVDDGGHRQGPGGI